MDKTIIKAPKGIKYISEWEGYNFPEGHCIVDKGVTGCGYTEYCLSNPLPLVLCSPRKLLLENKAEQHESEQNILYIRNDIENFEGTKDFKERVKNHISITCNKYFTDLVPKLLVTYDSSHYVIDALQEIGELENFYFVVDEFQSIFLDSFFKSEVEFDFVQELQRCPNVLYLSATPMLDKYLEKVPEFKDLDFYEIDWSETGIVENVVIKRKFAKSLVSECREIIQRYKEGKFDMEITKDQGVVVSNECVLYFNSIGDILEIIKKELLTPDLVNIICADTEENRKKLRKLTKDMEGEAKDKGLVIGEGYKVGRIPLRGEKNKMFTFCTRTAYIGADFYSPCASSYVFADPNITSLALDISLDLPQIVGRQRDRNNPFKNSIVIFYRTIRKKEMVDREAFDYRQNQRRMSTKNLLDLFNTATPSQQQDYLKKLKSDIKVSQYSDDFVSISSKTNLPVYNSFLEIANERAWDVSQKDYQDKISVTKALEDVSSNLGIYRNEIEKIAQDFLDYKFYKTGIFAEKMKAYCEFMDKNKGKYSQELQDIIYFKIEDDRFRKYYNFYGTSGCSSRKYQDDLLYSGMKNISKEGELRSSILKKFSIGGSYTLKELKFTLSNLYRDLGITKTAKATDLAEYYVLERVRFTDPETKKRIEGYKIVGVV